MKALKTPFLLALVTSLSAIFTFQASGQNVEVLSPTQTDTIKSGQLLIVVTLPQNQTAKPGDYKIVLDGTTEVKSGVQLRQNMLSTVYAGQLDGGKHYFELFELNKEEPPEEELLVTHHFLVKKTPVNLTETKGPPPKKTTKTPPKPKFRGNVNFSSNDADVTGPGAALRQEPPAVRQVALNVNIPVGKGEIPIKGFYTTNAQGAFAYRNTLNIGYQKNGSSITLGDHFVNQDLFTFNGIRVRGVFLDAFFPNTNKKLKIRFMYGKNVDMNLAPNNFPLPPDSANNIFQAAMPKYERDYYLVQFYVQHSKHAYGKFSFVRVRDYSEDELIAGIAPKDNMAVAWEKYIPIAKNRGYVRLNAAMAFTTLNNTLGGEPAFNFLIRLNSSTIPLTFKQAPQCAFGLATSIPITKNNDLLIDGRRIGASYFALANPFMLNNRQLIRVADNLRIFKNRFILSLSYDYLIDNLGSQRPQIRENSSASASMTLRISPKYPSLTLGYRYFMGNTYSTIQENFNVENTSVFGSLQYTYQREPMTYQIVISRNDMNLISQIMSNSRQEVTNLSLSATYKNRAGTSIQGTNTIQSTGSTNIPQEYFTAQVWYRFVKPDIRFKFVALTNTMEYLDLGKEKRKGFQAGIDYTFRKNFVVGVSAGYLPFTSYTENRSYTEQFIRITGAVRF